MDKEITLTLTRVQAEYVLGVITGEIDHDDDSNLDETGYDELVEKLRGAIDTATGTGVEAEDDVPF